LDALNVYRETTLVGHLQPAAGRGLSFRYAASWLSSARPRAISLSLPLQAEPCDPEVSRAWFANLLPEGEVREHVARRLGVSVQNEFALLRGIGGDCAGALRLLPGPPPAGETAGLIPLPWSELEAKIAATPRPSLLAVMMQPGGLRLSLAGAQDKLPVHFVDGRLSLPAGSAASTHLLKIPNRSFPDLVQNELLCLSLARESGLPVPPARLAPVATPILLVQRYDRDVAADGTASRWHQEDFCQALGLPPEAKYENEGGPSLALLFAALDAGSASPLPDRRDLLRWVLFNFVVGNADAHAKNISLLHEGPAAGSGPRLAPFYDLVCTEVYEHLSGHLAQKIGGEYHPRRVARRHWDRFAAEIDVNPRYVRDVALALCDRVEARASPLADELGAAHGGLATLRKIVAVVDRRVSSVRGAFTA